jgi:hypothetical protein
MQLIPPEFGFVFQTNKIIARHSDKESSIVCEKMYGATNNKTALKQAIMEWSDVMQNKYDVLMSKSNSIQILLQSINDIAKDSNL